LRRAPTARRQSRSGRGALLASAAWLAAGALLATCSRSPDVVRRAEGRFGTVAIYAPAGTPRALVFLFSGESGWDDGFDRVARAVAADGAAVVGVDLRQYERGLAASDDGCHYLLSEVEDLSHRVQRDFGFAGYASPILAGVGSGATLAYAALAQSPAATVAGALSVDPTPGLATRVPLCAGAPSTALPGGGFGYGKAPQLPGWWHLSPPDAWPGLSGASTPLAAAGSADERLLAGLRAVLPAADAVPAPLADLPLVTMPPAHAGATLAVIYSGDGGWRDIDKQIGEVVAQRGWAVVGVDSLRYFWRAKTPQTVADDLSRIIAHFSAAWQTRSVALIGYSFGAGILPFAYNRLPAADRARVGLVALLGVEHHAPFELKVAGWLGGGQADAPAVLPEVQRLPAGVLLCVYGEQEEDTLCRDDALRGAAIVRTSGGHHFDGNYRALAERLIAAAAK
jgi:type IV secretory pathway VirJ component